AAPSGNLLPAYFHKFEVILGRALQFIPSVNSLRINSERIISNGISAFLSITFKPSATISRD
ncbi:hypothetical protein QQX98_012946, partial [Neonectria punicea]